MEDWKWCFNRYNGFFVPVFDTNGYIQGLSIHLDKAFNDNKDIWFSSVILTDNLLLGALAKDTLEFPIIAFQNISNSYTILKEIENTNIRNITFLLRIPECNNNLDYIINRIFRDLLPLGYNLDIKDISSYKDFLNYDFNVNYTLNKVA